MWESALLAVGEKLLIGLARRLVAAADAGTLSPRLKPYAGIVHAVAEEVLLLLGSVEPKADTKADPDAIDFTK